MKKGRKKAQGLKVVRVSVPQYPLIHRFTVPEMQGVVFVNTKWAGPPLAGREPDL